MKKSRYSDTQIMETLKPVDAGLGVPDVCRELGISTAAFYKWRAKYGGMDVSMMSRLKELEEDNRRLKKMYLEEKIKPSYSRPRVSDDNAFIESLFRTAKYRLEFPNKGFVDLDAARTWVSRFVNWYNHEHLHSGIRYISPADRPDGHDRDILEQRHAVYQQARARNPRRWAKETRSWSSVDVVTLNPEKHRMLNRVRKPCWLRD